MTDLSGVAGFSNCPVCLKDLPPRREWLDPKQVRFWGDKFRIPVHTACFGTLDIAAIAVSREEKREK
jgi:hypothetical protein